MQSDREIPYTHEPNRALALLPMILFAVVLVLAAFFLMALGFKDSPFLSAGFVVIIVALVFGGSRWLMSDTSSRSRAHAEQMSTVIPSAAQAIAPAVANAVMQILGGVMAQNWPAGGAAPASAQIINHRPPQAITPQLPARVVSVPRHVVYNQAVPANIAPYQPIEIETVTGDDDETPGATITVPLNHLMRFASCPTPSRNEWQGKPQLYGEAARVFLSHGLMTRTNRGGFAWKPEYPVQSRRTWLAQYEARALGAGAHASAGEAPLLEQ